MELSATESATGPRERVHRAVWPQHEGFTPFSSPQRETLTLCPRAPVQLPQLRHWGSVVGLCRVAGSGEPPQAAGSVSGCFCCPVFSGLGCVSQPKLLRALFVPWRWKTITCSWGPAFYSTLRPSGGALLCSAPRCWGVEPRPPGCRWHTPPHPCVFK